MGLQGLSSVSGWFRGHPLVLGIALAISGLLILVVGVLGITSTSNDASTLEELRAGGGTAEYGTLVGTVRVVQERAPNIPDRTRYCPRYAYTAADGVERTIIDHDDCVSVERQLEGRSVDLLVDTDDPSIAFVDEKRSAVGRTSDAIFAWAMLTLGTSLIVAAPFMFVRARRRMDTRTDVAPKHL